MVKQVIPYVYQYDILVHTVYRAQLQCTVHSMSIKGQQEIERYFGDIYNFPAES